MFCLLALIWGSSFLWIKAALGNDGDPFLGIEIARDAVFAPLLLVIARLTFGALGLAAIAGSGRIALPRDPRVLAGFSFMGVFYAAIPFGLITWSETRIDSGMAAILNGTVPLITIMIAHVWLADEPATRRRVTGLLVGFVGVVLLVADQPPSNEGSPLVAQLAVLGAAASYGVSSVFSRRHLAGQSPVAESLVTMVVGDVVLVALLVGSGAGLALPDQAVAWVGAIWLGLLGSCAAYVARHVRLPRGGGRPRGGDPRRADRLGAPLGKRPRPGWCRDRELARTASANNAAPTTRGAAGRIGGRTCPCRQSPQVARLTPRASETHSRVAQSSSRRGSTQGLSDRLEIRSHAHGGTRCETARGHWSRGGSNP